MAGAAMAVTDGMTEIGSEAELREVLDAPRGRALTKERVRLHERDVEWLAASPFCLIATSALDGTCDVSPKGDPPGFVTVLDENTIAIPDRKGNHRADGFLNILGNPHVGLIFLVPGRKETLRINGSARIVRDAPFFDDMIVKGHRPTLVLVVSIQQIFFHCQKSFMRADLWNPQSWRPDALPSHAALVKSVQPTEESLADLERYYGDAYLKGLYG
jgi:PPOX class probable FMN-dependent enzyme